MLNRQPAIFLDKDNTLIPDIPYNVEPALISLTPGVGEALRTLQAHGYQLVVVTNQSGIARGLFPESALGAVKAKILDLLREYGVHMDGFYYCPHHPGGRIAAYVCDCDCRKPRPGLLLRAAEELHLDLARSWMIGDIAADIEAGRGAGCSTVLFTRYCDADKEIRASAPDYTASTFEEIVELLLCEGRSVPQGLRTGVLQHP